MQSAASVTFTSTSDELEQEPVDVEGMVMSMQAGHDWVEEMNKLEEALVQVWTMIHEYDLLICRGRSPFKRTEVSQE